MTAIGCKVGAHIVEDGVVGKQQASPECVCQQLAAQVVEKVLLTVFAQVLLQPVESGAFAATGKCRASVHRPAGQILLTPLTDRAKAFEDEPKRIEACVAAGTTLVLTMFCQGLAERQVAGLRFVAWQFG